MNCEETKELLSPYLDGMTGDHERQEIENHLQKCPDCQKELEELKKLLNALHSLERVKPPKDFLFRVKKALNEEKSEDAHIPFPNLRYFKYAGVAAVFLVFSLSFYYSFEGRKQEIALNRKEKSCSPLLDKVKHPCPPAPCIEAFSSKPDLKKKEENASPPPEVPKPGTNCGFMTAAGGSSRTLPDNDQTQKLREDQPIGQLKQAKESIQKSSSFAENKLGQTEEESDSLKEERLRLEVFLKDSQDTGKRKAIERGAMDKTKGGAAKDLRKAFSGDVNLGIAMQKAPIRSQESRFEAKEETNSKRSLTMEDSAENFQAEAAPSQSTLETTLKLITKHKGVVMISEAKNEDQEITEKKIDAELPVSEIPSFIEELSLLGAVSPLPASLPQTQGKVKIRLRLISSRSSQ